MKNAVWYLLHSGWTAGRKNMRARVVQNNEITYLHYDFFIHQL